MAILEQGSTEAVETKADAFKRLATARVNKLLDQVRLLGNLSARGNYEFTEEQIASIFAAIESELAYCQRKFNRQTEDKKSFSL